MIQIQPNQEMSTSGALVRQDVGLGNPGYDLAPAPAEAGASADEKPVNRRTRNFKSKKKRKFSFGGARYESEDEVEYSNLPHPTKGGRADGLWVRVAQMVGGALALLGKLLPGRST
ncbi:MAG: hypothetical protein KDJ44_16500 [Rhodoblastus sp.]|nr:hypothetical protein [Rhodoblastus sp.]